MIKKISRMESNKTARRILAKHGVDFVNCQYSCCGKDIMLSGTLLKLDGSAFNGAQIRALVSDFQRFLAGSNVIGDFTNCKINGDNISMIGCAEPAEAQEAG